MEKLENILSQGNISVNIKEDREAVFDTTTLTRYTYGDMQSRAKRLANFLVYELNLEKGDRIAFCSRNNIAFIDAFYATYLTGIIITTYNNMLSVNELKEMIGKEVPKVMFYEKKYADLMDILKLDGVVDHFVLLDGTSEREEEYIYENIMEKEYDNDVFNKVSPEDIQMLVHTGGTTGTPKAAMISFRSVYYNMLSELESIGIYESDVLAVVLPFFHTAAWNVFTVAVLSVGGRIVIGNKIEEHTLNLIEEEKITMAIAVETIYKEIANNAIFYETDFSTLRFLVSGAAPIGKDVMEKYWAKGVKLVSAYGMTEIGPNNIMPRVASMTMEEIKSKWNSVGKPMKYNDVKIINEEGQEADVNEIGELLFKGKLVFSGYWQSKENITDEDGYIHSGDIGKRDSEGNYYIVGRRKNMYISGGENIFPIEIENSLLEHPDIIDCIVFGVDDERWGEVGKALIVSDKSMSKEEIVKFVSQKLSKIKIPKYIDFVNEIPTNGVGKRNIESIKKLSS